jgi:hypothetical protein
VPVDSWQDVPLKAGDELRCAVEPLGVLEFKLA